MSILFLLLLGLAVGLLSSFLGIGGGMIMVPALLQLFPTLPLPVVTSTSLGVIVFISLLNFYHYWRRGLKIESNYTSLLCFNAIGMVVGSQLILSINRSSFEIVLGSVLILAGLTTLLPSKTQTQSPPTLARWKSILAHFIFLLAGVLSALTGLGGGVLFIPTLILLLACPIRLVPLYSTLPILINSVLGLILLSLAKAPDPTTPLLFAQFQFGQTNLALILLITLGSLPMTNLGIRLNQKIKPHHLKRIFALFILAIGIRMFF